jgi:4a-hydroxytetrahydrobiopterin dehydratase
MSRVLDREDLASQLEDLPGWTGDASGITRTYEAEDFPAVILLVDAVARDAEEMDHHPDIDIRWRNVTFACATHSEGGVTQLDVELAHRIHDLATEQGAI